MADPELSLGDAIRASVPATARLPERWFHRLSPEVLADLVAVRNDLRDGLLPPNKSAVARAIVEHLNARGLSDVRTQGVMAWLAERD